MDSSAKSTPARSRNATLVRLLAVWLVLLVASHVVRWFTPVHPSGAQVQRYSVSAIDGERTLDREVQMATVDVGQRGSNAPVVVLLHGSPGRKADFDRMLPELPPSFRVIAPDLPGFGNSTRDIPDYSVRAHARYLIELLDQLDVGPVHLVGFSMGGGVALEFYDIEPERVASLTLLSSIGVQEMELFGDYRMNHLVHAGQLAAIWSILELTPHFGLFDEGALGMPYARNFFDTDQRSLRGILERIRPPVFILHGEHDFLVPAEAAVEHRRLVPQAELQMVDDGHFMVFQTPRATAQRLIDWIQRVESGQALTRADASVERVAASRLAYDPSDAPAFTGMAMILAVGMIAVATLVSEDLTCIATGLVIAQGRIGFIPGVLGCFIGIFVGDLLLFLAGRLLGRPALKFWPLRWMLTDLQVDAASRWLDRRGPIVVLLSRFLPGFRLPTYFAAGTLHTRFRSFGVWFLLAAFLWTPILVWISMKVGESAFGYLEWLQRHTIGALVLLGLWIMIVIKLVIPLFSFRGRRMWVGRLRRIRAWEFWPLGLFYVPVVLRIIVLGFQHRSPLLFTAANPAMPASGFISEPKYEIQQGLAAAGEFVAATALLRRSLEPEARVELVAQFMREREIRFPVVLKPDAGQRGAGVVVVRSVAQVEAYLGSAEFDVLIQEYVPGDEFGVFYTRLPGEPHGQIFSVTEKRMPHVTGDGRHTVEELILLDRRAVCLAETYLAAQAERLADVPDTGEKIQLVELGTHSRGAVFLDGSWIITSELERAIDQISRGYEGFWFGRYDLRTLDVDALKRGEGFKIIELNGVTSESTQIYDPKFGLFEAWRILFRQWDLAFEIGRRNRERGAKVATVRELVGLMRDYRRTARTHPT